MLGATSNMSTAIQARINVERPLSGGRPWVYRTARTARTGRSVENIGGDQLFEVAVVPPADLELFGPAEVELDVVLDGEADAAEDLLGHGCDVTERLAGEQLRHRRQAARLGLARVTRPGRLVDEGLGAVDGGD